MTQWGLGWTEQQFNLENAIADHMRSILKLLGEDVNREGLKDTPNRIARYYLDFIHFDFGKVDTTFESIQTDQLVILKGVPFYSLCEHHLLPFWGEISVGYLTGERVIGLSKIARIIEKCTHRFQIQERLAHEIADNLQEVLTDSPGVIVSIEAHHSCMSMRGIKKLGNMVTNVLRGEFKTNDSLKQEFLMMIK